MSRAWIWLAISLAACGGDDDAPPPPKGAAATPAGKPAAKPGAKGGLVPQVHVEQRVPEKEQASIRHRFRPTDFVLGSPDKPQNRDPFQSFTIIQPGMVSKTQEPKIEVTPICTDKTQMVASNYSYADLKLVGILAQGTQRKVLMTDSVKGGYIIKRGDCVGKEKAHVKDISIDSITFEIQSDASGARPIERAVLLNPNQVQMAPPDEIPTARTTTIAPVVAPPPSLPSGGPSIPPPPMPTPGGGLPPMPARPSLP